MILLLGLIQIVFANPACIAPDLRTDIEAVSKISACFVEKDSSLRSKNCAKDCRLLRRARAYFAAGRKVRGGPIGNPAYFICRDLGGQPLQIQVQIESQWQRVPICLYEDNSYVDLETMLRNL